MYERRNSYYFVTPDGVWEPLGKDYSAALRRYASLAGAPVIDHLSSVFDRYQLEVLPKKAARTQKDQHKQLELLRIAFGHLLPRDLTTKLIIRYRNARGQLSKTQANQELALLSHVCTMCVEWELMEFNPCRDVKKYRLDPRDLYVTDADYRAVYDVSNDRLQILMDLALLTGQREGDLLGLQWKDVIDHEEGGLYFQQGKTGKRLLVEWSPELRQVIDRAKLLEPQSDFVVPTEAGTQYTTDGFQSLWRRARERAMSPSAEHRLSRSFHFNDLRAKSASDDTLMAASERLGHADPRLTERVYRRAPRKVKPLDIKRLKVSNE